MFKISRVLLFVSGLFPLFVGLYSYAKLFISNNFSFYSHIAFTNLVSTGFTICICSYFGLKEKNIWIILFLFLIMIWSGVNDLYATMRVYYSDPNLIIFPFPIIPVSLSFVAFVLISLDFRKNE